MFSLSDCRVVRLNQTRQFICLHTTHVAAQTMSNLALNRTVAACYENGSTNIPLPKSFKTTINVDKWRARYEDAEKKRKGLISQQERGENFFTLSSVDLTQVNIREIACEFKF